MATLRTSKDLFDQHTMSFGEHLEQLRTALVKASLWLVLGTLVGFTLSEQVVERIADPFRRQLRAYHLAKTSTMYRELTGTALPAEFEELLAKQQVIPRYGFVLELPDVDLVQDFRTAASGSRHVWLSDLSEGRARGVKRQVRLEPISDSLNSFGIFEGFYVYLQASLVVGVLLGLPGIFWHLWSFIAAGLYRHERRRVYQFLPLALGLFGAGAGLAYYVLIDLLIAVMFQYNLSFGIEIQPRLKDCFSLAMWLPLIFGVSFQLPLVMSLLSLLGLVEPRMFLVHQKVALLAITLFSMVLTPADPYTFLGLMLPLIILYYLGIALAQVCVGSEPNSRTPYPD